MMLVEQEISLVEYETATVIVYLLVLMLHHLHFLLSLSLSPFHSLALLFRLSFFLHTHCHLLTSPALLSILDFSVTFKLKSTAFPI